MKVIKRDGRLVDWDFSKVENAVQKAYDEVGQEFTNREKGKLKTRFNKYFNSETQGIDSVDIETIQEWVEFSLMDFNKPVAEAYTLERERRRVRRESIKEVYYNSEFLDEEFLSKYDNYPKHMNALAQFTFLRTYSRDIPELNRRETWKETCIRSVDHNIGMDNRPRTADVSNWLKQEAEWLFDLQFNLRGFLSGRALYTGGSSASRKYPLSLFNCSYTQTDELNDYGEILYALSVGAGVGYTVTEEVLKDLPLVKSDVKLVHMPMLPVPKFRRKENTEIHFYGDNKVIIEIGDSKEGWQDSLVGFMEHMSELTGTKEIWINYNNVRNKGEVLKTFGGYASGPEPLQNMFTLMHEVMSGDYTNSFGDVITKGPVKGKLRPKHVWHMNNMIANAIVVGGVRRSAMLCLFDRKDKEMLEAKMNIDFGYNKYDEEGNLINVDDFRDYFSDPKISHYWLSNNSMMFEEGYEPPLEELQQAVEVMKKYGEPAFVNMTTLKERHEHALGFNPCVEILLRKKQTCNLVTQIEPAYVIEGKLNEELLYHDLEVLTRSAVRVTLNKLEIPEWDEAQKLDRLLGVSPSGSMDMLEMTGMTDEEEIVFMKNKYSLIRKKADSYCDELGVNRPLNVTAVKPSGTLSLTGNGYSAGRHNSHAPFFLRTVRVSKNNPIYKVIMKTNWRIEDSVTEPDTTAVVYFPQKAPVSRTKADIGLIEQLESYKRSQQYYSDQNTSITIDVKPGEWDMIAPWVKDNFDYFTGVSFLAYLDNDHGYAQAPYITITEEEFNSYPEYDILNHDFITKYMDLSELYQAEDIDDPDCATGACGSDRL